MDVVDVMGVIDAMGTSTTQPGRLRSMIIEDVTIQKRQRPLVLHVAFVDDLL